MASTPSRIARELHDGIAHSVSLMGVQAGAAEQDPPSRAMRIAIASDHAGFELREHVVDVVTLSGRRLRGEQADAIVEDFLSEDFEGGRHSRRFAGFEDLP